MSYEAKRKVEVLELIRNLDAEWEALLERVRVWRQTNFAKTAAASVELREFESARRKLST